jgi:hypothetical protein
MGEAATPRTYEVSEQTVNEKGVWMAGRGREPNECQTSKGLRETEEITRKGQTEDSCELQT